MGREVGGNQEGERLRRDQEVGLKAENVSDRKLRSSEGEDLLKVTQSGDKMNVLSYLDSHGWLQYSGFYLLRMAEA